MNEMSVGDIGVLQNIIHSTQLNGCVAEIIDGLKKRRQHGPDMVMHSRVTYRVKHPIPNWNGRYTGCVFTHQIRPLTNPDAEKETEREKEKVL